jgi:hypothetical protein
MSNNTLGTCKPIDDIDADDVRFDYHSAIKTKGEKAPRLIALDFHMPEGWVRVKPEDEVSDVYAEKYAEAGVGEVLNPLPVIPAKAGI